MTRNCFTQGVDVLPGSPRVGSCFRGDGLVLCCIADFPQNVDLTNDPSHELRNHDAGKGQEVT